MLRRLDNSLRQGTSVVEFAIIANITFFLLLGLVIGGMGIFRYQEMAGLAREAARYASAHGAQYRKDTGQGVGSPGTSAGTSNGMLWYQANPSLAPGANTSWTQDIYDNAVRPGLASLNPNDITCLVGWPPVINQPSNPDNWPGSTVDVTLSYQWFPELYIIGPITLTCTSSMPITN